MLTLDQTKLHLRVDLGGDDALILALIAAATTATGDYIGRTTPLDDTAPAPIKAAAMLLVGDLYANRESQVERKLYDNATYERLLNPYRAMTA